MGVKHSAYGETELLTQQKCERGLLLFEACGIRQWVKGILISSGVGFLASRRLQT